MFLVPGIMQLLSNLELHGIQCKLFKFTRLNIRVYFLCLRPSVRSKPNTIHWDNSSEYSTGRKFATGYSAGTILLPITQKIRHYDKNESYLTQWHTKGFKMKTFGIFMAH